MKLEENRDKEKDSNISDKYTIIKSFYEKYLEMINERIIENIEQNMILKFNLKELLEQLNLIKDNVNLFKLNLD